MPLPTLEKSYVFDVGRSITAGYESGRTLLRQIVGTFTGFSVNPMVCRGSSDGITGALDGVNRWIDDDDMVYVTSVGSTSAQSWLVVRNAVGLDILIRCVWDGSSYRFASIWTSRVGFTGGSATAPPTASDQSPVATASAPYLWMDITVDPGSRRVQALHSTDGRETRLFITGGNRVATVWLIGEFSDAPAALTNNSYCYVDPGYSSVFGDNHRCAVIPPVGAANAAFGCEHSLSVGNSSQAFMGLAANQQIANEINNQWSLDRIEVWRVLDEPYMRFGRLKDVWSAEYASLLHQIGTTYPVGSARQFAQFGPWVVPWNGTLPAVV